MSSKAIPIFVQGTYTPLVHARAGRTGERERRYRTDMKWRISFRRPVTANVLALSRTRTQAPAGTRTRMGQ